MRGKAPVCFLTVGGVMFLVVLVVMALQGAHFRNYCTDYLKLAADAPTIDRADAFLSKAIEYLDRENLVAGNTGLVFKFPSNDISIWRLQLAKVKTILVEILGREKRGEVVSALERTNVLMKVRETLVEQGEFLRITHPVNISLYPDQRMLWGLLFVSIILMIWAVIGFAVENLR